MFTSIHLSSRSFIFRKLIDNVSMAVLVGVLAIIGVFAIFLGHGPMINWFDTFTRATAARNSAPQSPTRPRPWASAGRPLPSPATSACPRHDGLLQPESKDPVTGPAAPPLQAELHALLRRMRLPYLRKCSPWP